MVTALLRTWRTASISLAIVLVLATSCGSTVPRAAGPSGGQLDASSSGFDAAAGTRTTANGPGDNAATSEATSNTAGLANGATRARAAAVAESNGGAASNRNGVRLGLIPAGPRSHGVTDEAIEVGLLTVNSAATGATFAAVTGTDPVEQGTDYTKGAQAVVDYVNAHGGVAGRKVVPIYHEFNAANLTTDSGRAQEAQSACADWTEDHHAFAMMNASSGKLWDCGLNSETMVIGDVIASSANYPMSQSAFEKYRNIWFTPNRMLEERRERNLAESLWQRGFFTARAKVAVMLPDDPNVKEGVANGMIPALASHEITPSLQIVYPDPIESNWQNYTLQMQQEGITHVLFASDSGLKFTAELFTMRAAENQRYFPKWAIASDNAPGGLAATGAPRSQMANTVGMGYLPVFEVSGDTGTDSNVPSDVESPNAATCFKIGNDIGQASSVILYCETLFFLQYVLDRVPEVSLAGVNAAMDIVRHSYPSTWTISGLSSFRNDRHDGPSFHRDFVFDNACSSSGTNCWRYLGANKPLS